MSESRQPPLLQLLIQIDGLSRPLLEDAMSSGDAPTLAQLAQSEQWRVRSVFSGMPSTTPAVQAELFYGRRHAVPAFAYFDRGRQQVCHMLDPATADAVQRELDDSAPGLLADGAAYCDIYTGGALAARFCPAGLARPREAFSRSLRYQFRSLAAYMGVLVRAVGMLIGEMARGVGDLRSDHLAHPGRHIGDAWNRIVATIALRDQSRISAIDDIALGLPVVHVNFVGYDKQAHKYGPNSAPARRALHGVDRAIKTLLRAANDSAASHITTVIYSDHGQEATTPFATVHGESIDAVIQRLVEHTLEDLEIENRGSDDRPRITERLSEEFGERVLGIGATRDRSNLVSTIESGPIAHVYFGSDALQKQTDALAESIAEAAPHVAVLWRSPTGEARAALEQATFASLSDLCASRLGDHPFRNTMAEELRALLEQPNCGDIVLLGTGFGDTAITFAPERGSHGGPGPLETHAFAILPQSFLNRCSEDRPLRFDAIRSALLEDREAAAHSDP